jgi:diguanylate cyclase (GGDEF)-like protein
MGEAPFLNFFRSKPARSDGSAPEQGAGGFDREQKLAIVEELERSGAGWFWATDAEGRATYLSPSLVEAMRVPEAELIGQPMQTLFSATGIDGDARSLGLKLGTRKAFSDLPVTPSLPASTLVLRFTGRPLTDDEGGFLGFRGSATDATEEFERKEDANRLAKFDPLTGLSNRARMERTLEGTLTAFRGAKRSCALLLIDLDRFKQVNDTLGHPAGDQLLKQVAKRLTSAAGQGAEVGRLGGDEFQVFVPDLDDRGKLGELARKIITMISQPYSLKEGRCSIGASAGIAIAPYDGVEPEELTRAADLALYAAKDGGRGQFRFYGAELEHDAVLRKRMEADLAVAIAETHFALEYQPIVRVRSSEVVALQAVCYWEDGERGRVEPDTYLPIAEASQQIVQLGNWILTTACKEAAGWPGGLRLLLNIGAVQFNDEGFVDLVSEALRTSGLDPQRLEIEVGEAVFLANAAAAERNVSALFRLGVRLALDQFGTGSVSLSYLRRAPFSSIRIDQAFFQATLSDESGDLAMIRAIVELAKVLQLDTVAGGVQSPGSLEELRALGVDLVQGFVFAQPMPAEELEGFLADGNRTLEPSAEGAQRAGRRTVFRRVGVIHENHYYEVTLRNLSRTGALIEGLKDVPVGSQFVLDFGQGQLAVATVRRTDDDTQGLEFETPLVDDGAGGLCTRHRVSPYELAAVGAPLSALPPGRYSGVGDLPEAGPAYPRFKLSNRAPRRSGEPG